MSFRQKARSAMKLFSILLISLIFAPAAWSKSKLAEDLPSKDFRLNESVPKAKNVTFQTQTNGSQVLLISNLSPSWGKGLSFDVKDMSLAIQGLGASVLKTETDGYLWMVSEKGQTYRKEGKLQIRRSPEGCTMTWNFLVKIGSVEKLNERGSISYSCKGGALSRTLVKKPEEKLNLKMSDLLPRYRHDSASLISQLDQRLEDRSDDLRSCISRNINRPATLKDENRYVANPEGNVAFRLRKNGENLEAAPYSTANDARMDSCVIDIIRTINAKDLAFDSEKYLVFDAKCKNKTEDSTSPFDCVVRSRVYDKVTH